MLMLMKGLTMNNKFNPVGDRYRVNKVECLEFEETRTSPVSEPMSHADAVSMLDELQRNSPDDMLCIQLVQNTNLS